MLFNRRPRIEPSPTPPALLLAYREFVTAAAALDEGRLANLGRVHQVEATRTPGYEDAATRAAELAYGTGRCNGDDRVIGVPAELGDLATVAKLAEGGALDVAYAILTHDLLDPAEFALLTRWWHMAWGELPTIAYSLGDEPDEPDEPTPAAAPLAASLAEQIPTGRPAKVARPAGPPPDWPPANNPRRRTPPPRSVDDRQPRRDERLDARRAGLAHRRRLRAAAIAAYVFAAAAFAATPVLIGMGAYSWALACLFLVASGAVGGRVLAAIRNRTRTATY